MKEYLRFVGEMFVTIIISGITAVALLILAWGLSGSAGGLLFWVIFVVLFCFTTPAVLMLFSYMDNKIENR